MQKRLVLVLSAILVIAVVAVGAFELGVRFGAFSAYASVTNQAIGANVRVSGPKVPRNIHAVVKANSAIKATPVQQQSPIIDIAPSGALPAPVTLTFRMSRQVKKTDAVFVETQESPTSSWTLIPSTVAPDGWSVSVTTSHFSSYQYWWTDLMTGINVFKQNISDALGALTGDVVTQATPPHCDNDYYRQSDAQRAGYLIGSSTRDTLYWCFGLENGQRVLKIVNRKSYPVDVNHRGFTLIHQANTTADLDQIARLVAGSQTVLFPFEEVDYTVNMSPLADSQAAITTSFAGDAQSLYALQVGLSTAATLVTLLDGGANTWTAKDRFYQAATYMGDALTEQGCVNAFRQSSVGGDIGTLISSCFTPETILKLFGKWGPILVANFFVAPLIEFFRSEFTSAVDQFTNGDLYEIVVARTGSLASSGSSSSSSSSSSSTSSTSSTSGTSSGSSGSSGGTSSGGSTGGASNASIQIGWSSSYATYIWMTFNGFTLGSYQYTCSFSTGGDATFTVSISASPQTFDNGKTCYDTVPGDVVWVVVGGIASNKITVPSSSAPPPPSTTTYSETAGPFGSGTFTNYTNAGGTLGQRVAAYQTIQVSCRRTGWTAPDGDNWWYLVVSSPWNSAFYTPADNFYNNGQTSGSLTGTPFVDTKVPLC